MALTGAMDGRRIDRAVSRLGASETGIAWLTSLGIGFPFARRLGIGLMSEDGDELVIVHPVRRRDGEVRLFERRVSSARNSGSGGAHWSDAAQSGVHLLVLPSLPDLWRLEQVLDGRGLAPFVAVAPIFSGRFPIEWQDASHWSAFPKITALVDDPFEEAPLLSVLRNAVGERMRVALPSSGTWRDRLEAAEGFDVRDLTDAVDHAPPINRFAGTADDVRRRDARPVALHGLDEDARMMRVLRIEEFQDGSSPGAPPDRQRYRNVVVRSDAVMLDVLQVPAPPGTPHADRIVSLSDGTRLAAVPRPHCVSRWTLRSATGFLVRGPTVDPGAEAERLFGAVASALASSTGLAAARVDVAAAFVLLSHVCLGFDAIRVPVFAGGDPATRSRLMRGMAALSHVGCVVGRCRSAMLERIAASSGGALLLDEPGPLAGPSGPTEIGRFLIASSVGPMAGLQTDASIFGARAVFAERFGAALLAGIEHRVQVDAAVSAPRSIDGVQLLLDDLYTWSMSAVGNPWMDGLGAAAREAIDALIGRCPPPAASDVVRSDGIAIMADHDARPVQSEVGDGRLMEEALAACMPEEGGCLSLLQLMFEVALRGGVGADYSPERVGRWLVTSGLLEPEAPVTRRRLYGQISRLYELRREGASGDAAPSGNPFAFCVETSCDGCRYARVCPSIAPGMSSRKRSRS